jgi:hypothetical protein
MNNALICLVLLASCAAAPPANPPALPMVLHPVAPASVVKPTARSLVGVQAPLPSPPPEPPQAPPAPAKEAIVDLSPTVATLSAPELLEASEQARVDAQSYVAWRKSLPENIDRLNTLTQQVNLTVARMKANEIGGIYDPSDVVATRGAVRALRTFLAVKGD